MSIGQDVTPLKAAGAEERDPVVQEHHDELVAAVQTFVNLENEMRQLVSSMDRDNVLDMVLTKITVMAMLEEQTGNITTLAALVGVDLFQPEVIEVEGQVIDEVISSED